jgi:hypothetical protein
MTIIKSRTSLFSILMLIGLALLAEALAYTAWRIRDGSARLEEYQALKRSARSYRYHGDLGVVLPFPDVEIIIPSPEFTDRFLTRRLPGLPGGFFDDGLDEEADVVAVAVGDSFTRGVGSTDPETYGWVERVERSLEWLDIVNLGNSGTGQLQQFYFYDRVAPGSAGGHGWAKFF